MKTIYLKAEVTESRNEYSDYVIIGGNRYILMKKSLEQAQVLAVEEVQKYCKKGGHVLVIQDDGSITISCKEGCVSLPQLTELVRGKTRTLEDVINDLKKAETHEQRVRLIYQVDKILEAEQLLKNRE